MMLQPCDILYARTTGKMPSIIRYISGGEVNHVALIAHGGAFNVAIVVEALCSGVKLRQLYHPYSKDGVEIEVWRPINLTDENREIIVNAAVSRVGEAYGFFDIFTQLLDELLPGTPYFFRRMGKIGKWLVCSGHVIQAFNFGGLDFGLEPNEGQPDDLRKFCKENPEKYELIYPLGAYDG